MFPETGDAITIATLVGLIIGGALVEGIHASKGETRHALIGVAMVIVLIAILRAATIVLLWAM